MSSRVDGRVKPGHDATENDIFSPKKQNARREAGHDARLKNAAGYLITSYLPFFTVSRMRERASVPKRFFSVKL